MTAITFDTHKHVKELIGTGVSEEQAEAIITAIRTNRELDISNLVTKEYLKAELGELKSELFKWLVPLLFGQAALIAALIKFLG